MESNTAMNDVERIVSLLNKAPFSMNISLVDFDEKSPTEIRSILFDVLASIEPDLAELTNSPFEDVALIDKVTKFLTTVNCEFIPTTQTPPERRKWLELFIEGHRFVTFPLLLWLLSNREELCKRAYLAKYLMPLEPHSDLFIQENEYLDSLLQEYRELQDKFRSIHKHYDAIKTEKDKDIALDDLNNDVSQLRNQKGHLKEKIRRLQSKVKVDPRTEKLLELTKKLRLENEREVFLEHRKIDQENMLKSTEQKLSTYKHRLNELQHMSQEGNVKDENIIQILKKQNQETKRYVRHHLMKEKLKLEENVAKLSAERIGPNISQNDIDTIQKEQKELESKKKKMHLALEKQINEGTDMSTYIQHVKISVEKLLAKEEELKIATALRDELKVAFEKRNHKLDQATNIGLKEKRDVARGNGLDPSDVVHETVQRYEASKQELSSLQSENAVLSLTEQILKRRDNDLEASLSEEEKKVGISGVRDLQIRSEKHSEETSEVDEVKGQLLEEICKLIKETTQTSEDKKEAIKRLMKALEDLREEFLEIKQVHEEKKRRYDKIDLKFRTDRRLLEKECTHLQTEIITKERQHYQLSVMADMLRVQLEMSEENQKQKTGETSEFNHLPGEFHTLEKLYKNKLEKQESIIRELKKQQGVIKENEEYGIYQKKLFRNLKYLLDCKEKELEDTNNKLQNEFSGQTSIFDGETQILCIK